MEEKFVSIRPTAATVQLRFILLLAMQVYSAFGTGDQRLHIDQDERLAEYCIGEDFQPRCTDNNVIVILSARYGRMKVGRCIEIEPGFESMLEDERYLGCSDNVLDVVSQECTGRSECQLRVSDQTFDNVDSCFTSLKMYLEVAYVCVAVAAETRYCTVSVSSGPQHIVDFGRTRQHSETLGSRCGDKFRPWTVDALNGQRIVVSLIHFAPATAADEESASSLTSAARRDDVGQCGVTYGDVIDKVARKNVSICGRAEQDGGLNRVYMSQSNSLQIVFTSPASLAHQQLQPNFILHVQAVGCSDLVAPSDGAWLRREGDEVMVGCYMSRQSWHLRCVDGVWTGTLGLCPEHHYDDVDLQSHRSAGGEGHEWLQQQSLHHQHVDSTFATLALVAVSCAGLALCLLIICVGVACLRRQNRHTKSKLPPEDVERFKPLNGTVDSQSVNLSAATDDVNLQWHQQQRQQLVM